MRFKTSLAMSTFFVFAITFAASSSDAADQTKKAKSEPQTAAQLAEQALYHEAYGDTAKRVQLLTRAIDVDPDFAPARWHLGYVRAKGEWIKPDDLIENQVDSKTLKQYRILRDKGLDNAQQHVSAANWCRSNKLQMQARAHLEAAIAIEPDHAAARRILGHTRFGNQWLTQEEIEGEADKLQTDRESLFKWRAKLQEIGKRLHHENPRVRKQAEIELAEIDDANAILPMELLLSGIDEPTAQLVVESISKFSDNEAAISLARHAVFSPSDSVRQSAALKLRQYDRLAYVPEMLSSMQTPIINMRWATPNANGRLYYRHVLFVETQDTKQTAINNVEYRRIGLGGDRQETLGRVLEDMNREAAQTDMAARMQNMQTRELNERITDALTIAVSENHGNDPRVWWSWWDEENDVLVQRKQEQVSTQSRSVSYADRVQSVSGGSASVGSASGECLIAGTRVLTGTGFKAIETITTGDIVLSKNPVDGELAFKPVIRSTIRPGTSIVTMVAGDQEISCSDGHPFWVSGEGWTMAKNLKSGMALHTANGSVPIRSVSSAEKQETYNLVVADFHTYFVGEDRLLSHDVTMRDSVEAGVPGAQILSKK